MLARARPRVTAIASVPRPGPHDLRNDQRRLRPDAAVDDSSNFRRTARRPGARGTSPSPIPLPGALVVKNGRPARCSTSSGMPAPRSSTLNIVLPSWRRMSSVTGWSVGVASKALREQHVHRLLDRAHRAGHVLERLDGADRAAGGARRPAGRCAGGRSALRAATTVTFCCRPSIMSTRMRSRMARQRSTSWRMSFASSLTNCVVRRTRARAPWRRRRSCRAASPARGRRRRRASRATRAARSAPRARGRRRAPARAAAAPPATRPTK